MTVLKWWFSVSQTIIQKANHPFENYYKEIWLSGKSLSMEGYHKNDTNSMFAK